MEYEISELGRSLAPLFAALSEWSVNLDKVEKARQTTTPASGPPPLNLNRRVASRAAWAKSWTRETAVITSCRVVTFEPRRAWCGRNP